MKAKAWAPDKIQRSAVFVFLMLVFLLFPAQACMANIETDSLTLQTTVAGFSGMAQDGAAAAVLPDGTVITARGSSMEDGLLFVAETITGSDAYTWILSCLRDQGSDMKAYELYFVDSSGNLCGITGDITITADVGSGYENPSVYRVAADGTVSLLESKIADGCISFTMGGNGYFALLESPDEPSASTDGPDSSDNTESSNNTESSDMESETADNTDTSTAFQTEDSAGIATLTQAGNSDNTATAPQTGDSTNLWLWGLLILISGCGVICVSSVWIRKFMR